MSINKILIGVSVGAILGVLYAPDKGSITRAKLSRTGNDLRDKFNDFKDAISDKIDSLREDGAEMTYHETEALQNDPSAMQHSWDS